MENIDLKVLDDETLIEFLNVLNDLKESISDRKDDENE